MIKLKLTQKDIKLSFILIALIILGLTYQFVYLKNVEKTEAIQSENASLQIKLDDEKSKYAKKTQMEEESASMSQQIKDIINSYGDGASEEKSIMFIKSLEGATDITIDSVSFSAPEYFLTATNTDTAQDPSIVDSDSTAQAPSVVESDSTAQAPSVIESDSTAQDSSVAESDVAASTYVDIASLNGYKNSITVAFKVNYDGLKKCINFINDYQQKCSVGEVTTSFDSETGNLSGTMVINMYHLQGASRNYIDPIIPDVTIGTDNIFGTIELPSDQQ